MGFYGNITNTSKTQFQFDRTYSNRATMEANITTDGIYAGRYVLVEYDTDLQKSLDTFPRVYMRGGVAYTSPDFSYTSRINKKDIDLGDIVFTASDYVDGQPLVPRDCIFWKCTSILDEKSSDPATFVQVVGSESNYVMNFNIDTAKYGESRGYDSTVWQKVYINNIEKYVQIAELNSVVPTFDISADAPTIRPIQPHFDINSTNVYYKLHWQPQWGFRAKEAKGNSKTSSSDKVVYPSDETIKYTTYEYNPDNGTMSDSEIEYPAAIYYNKAGFDKSIRTRDASINDNIQVTPSGISGNTYNTHSLTEGFTNNTQEDIQEFRILLPSLGNTISDIWDIIYGHGQKVEKDGTLTGNISNPVRFKDIGWKDIVTGTEDISETNSGMTRDLETVAGCINKVHDLMGMIITDKSNATLNEEWFTKNYIYEDGNAYYRIHRFPTYTTNTVGSLGLPIRDNYHSDQEYNAAYEEKIAESLSNQEYFLIKDNTSTNFKVELLNKKSLSALNSSDIIGYQSGYGYEYVLIPDMAGKMATIYGLILQMKNLLEVEDSETRDLTTVTGTINQLNDIIKVFEDLVPGEFLICDVNGHVNSANWTTKQKYGYTNYGDNTKSQSLDNGIENRWLELSLNEEVDGENPRLITLNHKFNEVTSTTTRSDKNDEQKYTGQTDNGNNNTPGDTIDLYTPIVDTMGHVVGKNIETVTLPYSFKKITTNGEDNTTITDMIPAAGTSVADNTQDEFTINVGNKWLHAAMNANADTLTLAHEVNAITTADKATTDLNNGTNTITIQDTVYDAAGHVTANQNHTYTLPYGFKTIVPAAQSTAVTNPTTNTTPIIADNTQDTLNVASTNKWIGISGSDTNDTLSIGHEVHSFESGAANTKYGLEADTSINDLNEDNTFEVPVFKFDEAGHITMAETHTITIPENFDKVAVAVTGKDSTATNASSTAATLEAGTLTDTVTFDVGNRWIQLVGNEGSNKVSIYHAAPGAKTNTTKTENETPNYGAAFNIPEVKYDEAGHISGVATHTVTFPTPSFKTEPATSNSANIITNISMVPGTLAITQTNANVGTRTLEEYSLGDNNEDIKTTDTINAAFGKLQVQMHEEETNRANAINNLDTKLSSEISTVNTNLTKKIDDLDTELSNEISTVNNNLTQSIETEETARINAVSDLQNKITAEETARIEAINALDYSSPAVANEYISEVTQTDGKIAVTRVALPDYSNYWTKISTLEETVKTQGETIATLQNTIAELITRIETLEAHHAPEEEIPEEETPVDGE